MITTDHIAQARYLCRGQLIAPSAGDGLFQPKTGSILSPCHAEGSEESQNAGAQILRFPQHDMDGAQILRGVSLRAKRKAQHDTTEAARTSVFGWLHSVSAPARLPNDITWSLFRPWYRSKDFVMPALENWWRW